jgi:hypothetical protein
MKPTIIAASPRYRVMEDQLIRIPVYHLIEKPTDEADPFSIQDLTEPA